MKFSLRKRLGSVARHKHLRTTRQTTHQGLRYLLPNLRALGIEVPVSHANFVFAQLDRPAEPVHEQLLRRGVIARPVPNYGFPNALRISVGLRAHNERLVKALKEIL